VEAGLGPAYHRPVDEPDDRDRRFVLMALAALVPMMACAGTIAATPERSAAIPWGSAPPAIAALGRQFLAAFPEEGDREALRRALGLGGSEPEAIQLERIDAALRRDIDTGNVVHIEGWQLARTECRLYALAALS
jgi:hypothetical protein